MAYTSVLPVHRLDRSIDYVKDRAKTTKSAGSLEEAIDYHPQIHIRNNNP